MRDERKSYRSDEKVSIIFRQLLDGKRLVCVMSTGHLRIVIEYKL